VGDVVLASVVAMPVVVGLSTTVLADRLVGRGTVLLVVAVSAPTVQVSLSSSAGFFSFIMVVFCFVFVRTLMIGRADIHDKQQRQTMMILVRCDSRRTKRRQTKQGRSLTGRTGGAVFVAWLSSRRRFVTHPDRPFVSNGM
jgi:hypothetical protein